jgi:sugar/nucleoside kinase (ribokinase family)
MPSPREPELDVLGVGNAIVDVLATVDDGFLAAHGLTKGVMRLCSADDAERLYADMPPATEKSGGSVANAMAGVASFGGRAAFVGKVRDDQLGRVFVHDITSSGVTLVTPMAPASAGLPTARSLVLVTPDAQRTMNTSLGIAGSLFAVDVPDEVVASAAVLFVEGFLWDQPSVPEVLSTAMDAAHAAGRLVALSLSDPLCVDRHRDEFLSLVSSSVDVLFANEDEIVALYSGSGSGAAVGFDGALAALRARSGVQVAALTRGAAGSVIVAGGEVVVVPAEPVAAVVDTTGAGDLYAAGVLYGLTHGLSPSEYGRLGSLAAAEVISHVGARPERSLASLVAGRAG